MTVAHLAHPEWFAQVCWSVGIVVSMLAYATWRSRTRRIRLLGRTPSTPSTGLSRDAALLLAFGSIAIALLGPRIGERLVEVTSSGVDISLLVDVSRSMDASDTPPTRMHRARRAVEEILARLDPDDRVALAAFGSRGVLLTPLTPDRGAMGEWVRALDTDLIRPAGSNLAAGVRAAAEAFEVGSARPRIIAVFSDGEDPTHTHEIGAAEAASSQARVVAIAIGTEAGSAIPASDVPLRDSTGRVVVTRRNADRLQYNG